MNYFAMRNAGFAQRSKAVLGLLAVAYSFPTLAHDEHVYFTAQGGTGSAKLTEIQNVGGSFQPGTTGTDLNLDNSNLYGAKMGVYSRSGVLGLEAEVFRARPDVKPQTQIYNEPSFGPFPASRAGSQQITTWAVNLLVRVPLTERFVLHGGAGPAIFRSELQMANEQGQSSNEVGLNTQLGFTYFVTKNIALSTEWKHNSVRFKYPTHGNTEGFDTRYKANYVGVGISYVFDWAAPWRAPVTVRGLLGLEPARIGPDK